MTPKGDTKQRIAAWGLLWLRVLMGLGIAYHGYGKIFGGEHFGANVEGFAGGVAKMGFPMPLFFAWCAAFSEFAGGIFVALGLFTRLAALSVFATMSVAAFVAHADDPLKVKELALAYWTMSGALVLTGGGCLSLDKLLFCGKCKSESKTE